MIFWEIEILLENGAKTKYRPAKVISEDNLGPFVEIGSLATCTKIDCEEDKTASILPFLSSSFSNLKYIKSGTLCLFRKVSLVNLLKELNCCPRSK